jgi:hypothetical protein
MKTSLWLPPVVFVATAVPVVLLLNALDVAGDFRVWIALGCGIAATAFAQSRLAKAATQENIK